MSAIPSRLWSLFWDVDPEAVRLPDDADYVIERIMARGTWDAMRWLREAFDEARLVDFLTRKGHRLAPRERAYWQLVLGVKAPQVRGGGRAPWAGT